MLVALVAIVGTMSIASEAHADHHAGNHANLLPLIVEADQSTYGHDSTITVTGQVANVIPGNVPVTVTVINPLNSLVTIDQVNVSNDGSFTTSVSTSGNLMKYDGTYTIKVNYGSLDNKVKVELTGGVAVDTTHTDHSDDEMHHSDVECGSNEVAIHDACTSYDISGGHVISATVNTNDNSVIINIDADDDGTLTISPSTSTQEGIFMVLVDGEESNDAEINGNTVTVPFLAGSEQIEIIGTFVIPEFGTIAAMILAVAIISIVAISAKSRLSIVPRY